MSRVSEALRLVKSVREVLAYRADCDSAREVLGRAERHIESAKSELAAVNGVRDEIAKAVQVGVLQSADAVPFGSTRVCRHTADVELIESSVTIDVEDAEDLPRSGLLEVLAEDGAEVEISYRLVSFDGVNAVYEIALS